MAAVRFADGDWAEDAEFAAYGAATPALRALDAETAHDVARGGARAGTGTETKAARRGGAARGGARDDVFEPDRSGGGIR